MLVKLIKLLLECIYEDMIFEKYGIDLILQVNFICELEKVMGDFLKIILFEYNNIKEFVDYLVKEYESKFWIVLLKDILQFIKNEVFV